MEALFDDSAAAREMRERVFSHAEVGWMLALKVWTHWSLQIGGLENIY